MFTLQRLPSPEKRTWWTEFDENQLIKRIVQSMKTTRYEIRIENSRYPLQTKLKNDDKLIVADLGMTTHSQFVR